MKRKKHLDFYYRCMETGRMPCHGLCNNNLDKRKLKWFKPHGWAEFQSGPSVAFWAADYIAPYNERNTSHSFGPTRQTIVLFLAAMNDEL